MKIGKKKNIILFQSGKHLRVQSFIIFEMFAFKIFPRQFSNRTETRRYIFTNSTEINFQFSVKFNFSFSTGYNILIVFWIRDCFLFSFNTIITGMDILTVSWDSNMIVHTCLLLTNREKNNRKVFVKNMSSNNINHINTPLKKKKI